MLDRVFDSVSKDALSASGMQNLYNMIDNYCGGWCVDHPKMQDIAEFTFEKRWCLSGLYGDRNSMQNDLRRLSPSDKIQSQEILQRRQVYELIHHKPGSSFIYLETFTYSSEGKLHYVLRATSAKPSNQIYLSTFAEIHFDDDELFKEKLDEMSKKNQITPIDYFLPECELSTKQHFGDIQVHLESFRGYEKSVVTVSVDDEKASPQALLVSFTENMSPHVEVSFQQKSPFELLLDQGRTRQSRAS